MEREKAEREKKKTVWKNWKIIQKNNKSEKHPHAQCKYCSKEFKRAIPQRMQKHLDKKCRYAPNNAKSHKSESCMSEEEQKSFELLQDKALSLVEILTSYPFAIQWYQ